METLSEKLLELRADPEEAGRGKWRRTYFNEHTSAGILSQHRLRVRPTDAKSRLCPFRADLP